jgi:hypothetical protein
MLGFDVQTSTKENTMIEDIRKESHQYTDESVKQNLCQAYAVDLTMRNEDITEMKKHFENNISSKAESSQQNIAEFQACIELSEYNMEQTNKLVQDVSQGFDQLEQEIKDLKRAIETSSDTTIDVDQTATGSQETGQDSKQNTEASQENDQESTQESFRAKRRYGYNRFNDNYIGRTDLERNYLRELGEQKFGDESKSWTIERMKKSPIKYIRNFAKFHEKYMPKKTKVERKRVEKFCLFGCMDYQETHEKSTEIMKDVQIDTKTAIQTQDIYESISTAYDKCVETIIKIVEEVDKKNESEAKAVSSQINIVSIKTPEDACLLKLSKINIKQSNELEQNVALTVVMESINNMTSDVIVKAIMTDMMGLTQGSDVSQKSTQKSTQGSVLKQVNVQKSAQTITDSSSMVIIIIIIVVVLMFGGPLLGSMGGKYHDTYFNGPAPAQMGMRNGMATHNFMNNGMQPMSMQQDLNRNGIPDNMERNRMGIQQPIRY